MISKIIYNFLSHKEFSKQSKNGIYCIQLVFILMWQAFNKYSARPSGLIWRTNSQTKWVDEYSTGMNGTLIKSMGKSPPRISDVPHELATPYRIFHENV